MNIVSSSILILTAEKSFEMSLEIYRIICTVGFVLVLLGIVLTAVGVLNRFRPAVAEMPSKSQKSSRIKIYSSSSIGGRQTQQDYCLSSNSIPAQLTKAAGMFGVVCDGMGGMEGGETASRMCSELMLSGYYQNDGSEDVCQKLKELILSADRQVSKLTTPDGRLLNCGTTVVAAAVRGKLMYWASAGDSRIYHVRGGTIQQITRDHNFRLTLTERYHAGYISLEEIERNPQKNALISFVGKGRNLLVDTGTLELDPAAGDVIIMCSDGLYKALRADEILAVTNQVADKSQLPDALIAASLSNVRIKHDNITVMVLA